MDKKTQKIMFNNDSDLWATPQDFYDQLDRMFRFTLDPCADKTNAKCKKFYTIDDNGLSKSWENEVVFVNPPYSNNYEWVKKCYDEVKNNKNTTVALLIPARTDTKYFYLFCLQPEVVREIYFVRGRLKFGNSKNSAPFPSCVVVFQKQRAMLNNRAIPVYSIGRK